VCLVAIVANLRLGLKNTNGAAATAAFRTRSVTELISIASIGKPIRSTKACGNTHAVKLCQGTGVGEQDR
jgi:hypothetical protein